MKNLTSQLLKFSIVFVTMCFSASTYATTFTVTNTNNSGAGSYNQAILDSELDATATALAPHTININVGGTISNPLAPRNWITVNGPKDNSLIFSGSFSFISAFNNKEATYNNISFTNGSTSSFGGSMSFSASGAIMNFNSCQFYGNTAAQHGGAVFNNGQEMHFKNCTFYNNSTTDPAGWGGGAYFDNNGTASFENCTFSGNSTVSTQSGGGGGGAILVGQHSDVTIINCTFYNNSAALFGGAVQVRSGGSGT